MEFNEKLQELRKRKGLTQEELAEALYVSRTAISKWEQARGYPSLASLKAIASFFSVTIDELLSSDEVLTIAEENCREAETHVRDLVFGLLDCSIAMFLFLPFFGQTVNGTIYEVSLLSLTEIASYLKALYWSSVTGMAVCGILTLALQNCRLPFWTRHKNQISLLFNAAGAFLFIISLQPYAASFLFVLLAIKVLLLIKRP